MSHVTYSFVTGTGNGNGNDSCDSLSHNGNPLVSLGDLNFASPGNVDFVPPGYVGKHLKIFTFATKRAKGLEVRLEQGMGGGAAGLGG